MPWLILSPLSLSLPPLPASFCVAAIVVHVALKLKHSFEARARKRKRIQDENAKVQSCPRWFEVIFPPIRFAYIYVPLTIVNEKKCWRFVCRAGRMELGGYRSSWAKGFLTFFYCCLQWRQWLLHALQYSRAPYIANWCVHDSGQLAIEAS